MKTHAKRDRTTGKRESLIKEMKHLLKHAAEISQEKLKSLEARYNAIMENSDFQTLRSPFDCPPPNVFKLLNAINYLEESRKTRRMSERGETC